MGDEDEEERKGWRAEQEREEAEAAGGKGDGEECKALRTEQEREGAGAAGADNDGAVLSEVHISCPSSLRAALSTFTIPVPPPPPPKLCRVDRFSQHHGDLILRTLKLACDQDSAPAAEPRALKVPCTQESAPAVEPRTLKGPSSCEDCAAAAAAAVEPRPGPREKKSGDAESSPDSDNEWPSGTGDSQAQATVIAPAGRGQLAQDSDGDIVVPRKRKLPPPRPCASLATACGGLRPAGNEGMPAGNEGLRAGSEGATEALDRSREGRRARRNPTLSLTVQHSMKTSLAHVGLQVWSGCLVLADFLLSLPWLSAGCNVLELGCGTGILGAVLLLLRAKCVILTDIGEEVLSNCEHNLALNLPQIARALSDQGTVPGKALVRSLDWFHRWPPTAYPPPTNPCSATDCCPAPRPGPPDSSAAPVCCPPSGPGLPDSSAAPDSCSPANPTQTPICCPALSPSPRAGPSHSFLSAASAQYSFTHADVADAESASLVVAADVIYSDDLTGALFATLRQLAARGRPKLVVLALEKRWNFALEDRAVVAHAYKGFRSNVREVHHIADLFAALSHTVPLSPPPTGVHTVPQSQPPAGVLPGHRTEPHTGKHPGHSTGSHTGEHSGHSAGPDTGVHPGHNTGAHTGPHREPHAEAQLPGSRASELPFLGLEVAGESVPQSQPPTGVHAGHSTGPHTGVHTVPQSQPPAGVHTGYTCASELPFLGFKVAGDSVPRWVSQGVSVQEVEVWLLALACR